MALATAGRMPVEVVTLPINTGGAGGFAAGIRAAMESGAGWVWLMDDDGVPDPSCLAELLPHRESLDFFGPAVVAEHDRGRLTFPVRLPGSAKVVLDVGALEGAAVDGVVPGVVIPFNGVLVSRGLVERIGLPREEFFIWGDDVEYRWRAERAGARIGTVVGARFVHPAADDLGTPILFGAMTYNDSESALKRYCMCRNNVANLREYRGLPGVAAFVLKTLWFHSVTRRDGARLSAAVSAMWDGWRGDFTGHRRFLA
jgi:rhamnopyranosyl-N-acetylglucosaminyl-diphospho-decaprenol beta-1,3/1,4-galactofuranosyltransferase